MNHELV